MDGDAEINGRKACRDAADEHAETSGHGTRGTDGVPEVPVVPPGASLARPACPSRPQQTAGLSVSRSCGTIFLTQRVGRNRMARAAPGFMVELRETEVVW